MSYENYEMRLPEEGAPTGAGPGTGTYASGQRPRDSRRLGRGNLEIQLTLERRQATPGSPPAQSAALETEELTQAGLPRRRIRWTYDMNVSVIRAFFRATRGGAEMLHYRQQMRNLFLLDYPHLSYLSQQNLADRKRAIENRNLIPPTIIEQLRTEIHDELMQQLTQEVSVEVPHETQLAEIENISGTIPTVPTRQFDILGQYNENINMNQDELSTIVLNYFNTAKIKFTGMNPELRPHLPKPILNKQIYRIMNILNTTIIPSEIIQCTQYHQIIDLIFCCAYTVVTTQDNNGCKKRQDQRTEIRTTRRKPNTKPPWQIRLERKIEGIRKDLGYLTSYRDNKVSERKRVKFQIIKKRHLIHTRHEPSNETIDQIIDTVKQKLVVTVDKYRKYIKSHYRRTHNAIYASNEKRFYKMLSNSDTNNGEADSSEITISEVELFWSNIWSTEASYNKQASWLTRMQENASTITAMPNGKIDNETFINAVAKLHNWKQPGPDKIHNYYYKYLKSVHQPLMNIFNNFLENPDLIPHTMCRGITYLKPKVDKPTSPSQFRPITCLNTGYKLLTACLARMINNHCSSNNVISIQQKGCQAGTKGCKDQLLMDSIIINQAILDQRNMYAAFIDYQKAFDSIPHSWMVDILGIYKVHEKIIKCFEKMTKAWETQLSLNTPEGSQTSGAIKIRRGIYQGDSLSPLLFCLALNPLSCLLETSKYGYQLRTPGNSSRISHNLYMDDLKLYAGTGESLKNLIRIVEIFSGDISMKFGIGKCRTQNIRRGKYTHTDNHTTSDNELIIPLRTHEYYKYLGINQSLRIEHTMQKKILTNQFVRRMHQICKMRLNGRNIAKAINTYAIPLLTYSFGIISWSGTDLNALDCRIRTILTRYNYHHPRSAVERVNLPRKRGGRGIMNITMQHDKQINSLRKYFTRMAQIHTLYNVLKEADDNLTPLNLKSGSLIQIRTMDNLETTWKSKSIHGKYPNEITKEYVDVQNTHNWLKYGTLFPETEGHIIAIQDGVICTKNYMKYIIRDQNVTNDLCRMCGKEQETIAHIINGCMTLAATHYKSRHDLMGKIIYIEMARQLKFINEAPPYYKYLPQPVLQNAQFTIYWDRSIITSTAMGEEPIPNRPDMVVINREKKNAIIIDFANPLDSNIINTGDTKVRKYQPLSQFLRRTRNLDTVVILPIIISSTGTIPTITTEAIEYLGFNKSILTRMQKAVLIKTSSIVREVLE